MTKRKCIPGFELVQNCFFLTSQALRGRRDRTRITHSFRRRRQPRQDIPIQKFTDCSNGFACGKIRTWLEFRERLIEVVSIEYDDDAAGAERTLAE